MESPIESQKSAFEQLETYPWATDTEFLSGLTAILGPDPSSLDSNRLKDLELHARCFYFSRKFETHVDFESYRKWRESRPASELTNIIAPPAIPDVGEGASQVIPAPDCSEDSQSLSFAKVMQLVQTGQSIPGVKEIPDTVLEGEGTEPSQQERSKPWETANKKGSGLFDV